MSIVERYVPYSKGSVTFNNFGWLVRYDDYKKLEKENKALRASRDELVEVCDKATTALYDGLHGGDSDYARLSVKYTRSVLDEVETAMKKAEKQKEQETNE